MNNIESILKDIYNMINDMLKLAETKNASLIVFNSAIIIGLLALIPNIKIEIHWLYWIIIGYLIFAILMNALSLFFCFSALSPQLKHKQNELKLHASSNLIFFGSIARFTPDEFLEEIKRRYKLKSQNEFYEKDFASQIVIISQIASRKFELFSIAILCTIAGMLTPIGWFIHLIFFNPDRR